MFERTGEVAAGVYAGLARQFRYLFKRVRIRELPLGSEANLIRVDIAPTAPAVSEAETALHVESVLEPLPEARVTISDMDITYNVKEIEMFEKVDVTVEPMVPEELVLVSLEADLEADPPNVSRVKVDMPKWSFRRHEDWLSRPRRLMVAMMSGRVTVGAAPMLPRIATRSAGQGFMRQLPIRRKRAPLHLLSEQEKDEAWHHLLKDTGLPAEDVILLGIFEAIPVNRLKRIAADESGKFVDLFLKPGYLDSEPQNTRLTLGRNRRDGSLLKSILKKA